MFTFKKKQGARKIAIINGGSKNGKIIRLIENGSKKCCNSCGGCSKKQSCCKLSARGGCELCSKNPLGGNSLLGAILHDELKGMLTKESKIIDINDGTLVPIPNKYSRECLTISGPSGSGKSTYASNYAKLWKYMFPKRPIYLFSNVDKDECLDKLNPTRILLDESFLEDPIDKEILSKSLCIFDDIDFIKNKKVREAVTSLRDSLLGEGRHEDIYVLTTNHVATNGKETKLSLAEATSITLFPHTDSYHASQVLKRYCGLSEKVVKYVGNLSSRWITVNKRYPLFIMHENGVFFPSEIK